MDKEKILFTALSTDELSHLMEASVRRAVSAEDSKLPDGDVLLSTQQAAALICYKASTLYGLAKLNQIPFTKTRGKLLFSRNALLEWVRLQGQEPSDQALNQSEKGGKR